MERNDVSPARRALALDPGRKRTGIALSDPEGLLASPLETVTLPPRGLVRHVLALLDQHAVDTVVIGCPRLPSGDPGEIAALSQRLAEDLRRARPGLEILLRDEALTSWEAEQLLRERSPAARRGPRRRGRDDKGEVDRLAAALILQEFLDQRARGAAAEAPPEQSERREDLER